MGGRPICRCRPATRGSSAVFAISRRALVAAALLLPVNLPAALAEEPATQTAPSTGATEESRAEAVRLVETMHAEANAGQILSLLRGAMVQALQRSNPGQQKEKVESTVDDVLLPELQARKHDLIVAIAEVYAAHFTPEELRGLRQFYEQPLGQKLVQVQPQIAQQLFVLGQAWGAQVTRDALRKHATELRARGLNI